MIIANPIYDVVFKYLMEDIDIAKGLLSTILNTEIVELELLPQETTAEVSVGTQVVTVLRMDFVAILQTAVGKRKKVLIELQKSKKGTDIMRFRNYLGEHYQKRETRVVQGKNVAEILEIVTVYFLGFNLQKIKIPVVKVQPTYIDVVTEQTLSDKKVDDFLLKLNHESYVIQIIRLKGNTQTRLLKILNVFSQEYTIDNKQYLDYTGLEDEPLLAKMVSRLLRAAADAEMRKKMDLQDAHERTFGEEMSKAVRKSAKQLRDANEKIAEKEGLIQEKDSLIAAQMEELKALRALIHTKKD